MPFKNVFCKECGVPSPVHTGGCDNCGAKLEKVHETPKDSWEYKDALFVNVSGGYGMYIDPSMWLVYATTEPQFILCKDCADKMKEALPNLFQGLD
jgi:hypothetical protein